MRNAHSPEGPQAHQAAQDYRRMNNEEMINRLGLPRIAISWDYPEAVRVREQARIEHNACVAIRRAIFNYMEEFYNGSNWEGA